MRLLFLTARLPFPPNRGDRLRAYHILRHLAPEHEITLVSFIAQEGERPFLAELRPFCQEIHVVHRPPWRSAAAALANAWRRAPLQALYYRSAAMQRLVDRLLASRDFDAAYVHLFRMAPYVAQRTDLYRVLDLTDVISREVAASLPYRPLPWRAIYRLERPRIARYERRAAESFDEVWLISDVERQALAAQAPQAHLQVVPNGVDVARFHPTGQAPRPYSLLFVGHMDVLHNADAAVYLAEEILPRVRRAVPAVLTLAGAGDNRRVAELAALPDVAVRGFVPDLNRLLNETAVFVAPLRFAAGLQNKVLEAMAAGVPVVATPPVNAGLQAAPEREILLGADAAAVAAQIVRLLRDEEVRRAIGRSGRAFVQQRFTWQHAAARMRHIASLTETERP